MGYYAMLIPAFVGHLNPMIVLARALQHRGHSMVMLSALEAEPKIRKAGLEFIPIAGVEFPNGEWERTSARLGELCGLKASRFSGAWLARFARGILRDLPKIAAQERFDGLIMDQISVGAESVCESIGLPMAVACAALMFNPDWTVPPSLFGWDWRGSPGAYLRNLMGYSVSNFSGWRVLKEVIPFRMKHRLPPMKLGHLNQMPPSLVQVAQQPEFFDFPRKYLPAHFHYTGPWIERNNVDGADFPWERLDGRPLIYASLGTLQNRLAHLFQTIAEACAGLPAQLVITLGRNAASRPERLPGDPVVVGHAPQMKLLPRANLVITHGGLNTTLESLAEGLPLVVVPITNDQPGIAARVKRLGAGEWIPIKQLTAARLRAAVRLVSESPAYRECASALAKKIREKDGPAQGAELIELAFTSRERVSRLSPKTDTGH